MTARTRKLLAWIVCTCGDRATFLPHKSWCRAQRWLGL